MARRKLVHRDLEQISMVSIRSAKNSRIPKYFISNGELECPFLMSHLKWNKNVFNEWICDYLLIEVAYFCFVTKRSLISCQNLYSRSMDVKTNIRSLHQIGL